MQALSSFAAALAALPACAPALLGCAAVYKESGLLQEALGSLQKALALLEPAAAVAPAAAAAGEEGAAQAASQQPAASSPGQHAGQAGALEAAEAAPVVVPGLPCTAGDVRQAMAVVLTDLGTQQKLAGQGGWRQRYEAAVEACPSYAPAHYNLGRLHRGGQWAHCGSSSAMHVLCYRLAACTPPC